LDTISDYTNMPLHLCFNSLEAYLSFLLWPILSPSLVTTFGRNLSNSLAGVLV